jgi:hypothetical protein
MATLQPTFHGHVATTQDAMVLFEACLQGPLSHVPRYPHYRERSSLIRSGSVFIYNVNVSGKRWIDGVRWSPPRCQGNFEVYDELDNPFPPNRATKTQQIRPGRPGSRPPDVSPGRRRAVDVGHMQVEGECSSARSLNSSTIKRDGLVKKTISVTARGVTYRLVSYYTMNDVDQKNLRTPSQTENLRHVRPRAELTTGQSFRSPIEDVGNVGNRVDGPTAQMMSRSSGSSPAGPSTARAPSNTSQSPSPRECGFPPADLIC